jgi:amino-acid N-acetyltransferase
LRRAREADPAPLLALINGYADRDMLLRRTEDSLRASRDDFWVAEEDREVLSAGALTALGPGLGARWPCARTGPARGSAGRSWSDCSTKRRTGGSFEVLALTRRVPFFEALGFHVTRRERFLDKLMVDCGACPLNLCCDETAVVRTPPPRAHRDGRQDTAEAAECLPAVFAYPAASAVSAERGLK